jgi:hypothetical protein
MIIARTLFILIAIPFSLMAGLLLVLAFGFPDGHGSGNVGTLALCGGIFIYGSIFALKGQLPLGLLAITGLFLNGVGAIVWWRSFSFPAERWMGWVGIGLGGLWIVALSDAFLKARSASLPPSAEQD